MGKYTEEEKKEMYYEWISGLCSYLVKKMEDENVNTANMDIVFDSVDENYEYSIQLSGRKKI